MDRMCAPESVQRARYGEAYLAEADELSLVAEALAAHEDVVLPDDTGLARAHAAAHKQTRAEHRQPRTSSARRSVVSPPTPHRTPHTHPTDAPTHHSREPLPYLVGCVNVRAGIFSANAPKAGRQQQQRVGGGGAAEQSGGLFSERAAAAAGRRKDDFP